LSRPLIRYGHRLMLRSFEERRPGVPSAVISAVRYAFGVRLVGAGLMVKHASHRSIRLVAERAYFDNLRPFRIYGIDVLIPQDSEGYLGYKYGADWRIPKKEWEFWQDDGGVKLDP
jgi:hypothetical protein